MCVCVYSLIIVLRKRKNISLKFIKAISSREIIELY